MSTKIRKRHVTVNREFHLQDVCNPLRLAVAYKLQPFGFFASYK